MLYLNKLRQRYSLAFLLLLTSQKNRTLAYNTTPLSAAQSTLKFVNVLIPTNQKRSLSLPPKYTDVVFVIVFSRSGCWHCFGCCLLFIQWVSGAGQGSFLQKHKWWVFCIKDTRENGGERTVRPSPLSPVSGSQSMYNAVFGMFPSCVKSLTKQF